jgi:hypothetical protein
LKRIKTQQDPLFINLFFTLVEGYVSSIAFFLVYARINFDFVAYQGGIIVVFENEV